MYNRAMTDLSAMGLNIGKQTGSKTIEKITEEQNGLIEGLNEQIQKDLNTLTKGVITAIDQLEGVTKTESSNTKTEIKRLNTDITAALNMLQSKSDDVKTAIVSELVLVYKSIETAKTAITAALTPPVSTTDAATAGIRTAADSILTTVGSILAKLSGGSATKTLDDVVSSIDTFAKGVSDYWITFAKGISDYWIIFDSNQNTRKDAIVSAITGADGRGITKTLDDVVSSIDYFATGVADYWSIFDSNQNARKDAIVSAIYSMRPPPAPTYYSGGGGYLPPGGEVDLEFADGGISSGPLSGYPAMLHGTELIVPLNDPKSARPAGESDPEVKSLLRELVSATKAGKIIQIDGKPIAQIADKTVTARISRGMINDDRRLI
jgi:hypothetical protein